MCSLVDFIRQQIIRIFVQINTLEGRDGSVVLMGRVSVTISYSFRCLATKTVNISMKTVLLRI